jgi:hypothetical protein
MLLFGGEYCDGEQTTVYNELFRWNIEKVCTCVYMYVYIHMYIRSYLDGI